MRLISLHFVILFLLCAFGCSNSSSPLQPTTNDQQIKILSFQVNGIAYYGDTALCIIAMNDTSNINVIAFDQDKLSSYDDYHNNGHISIYPFTPVDTMIAQGGIIADTPYVKANTYLNEKIVFHDTKGLTKSLYILTYISE